MKALFRELRLRRGVLLRRTLCFSVLSLFLGLLYNTANPVGLRWSESPPLADTRSAPALGTIARPDSSRTLNPYRHTAIRSEPRGSLAPPSAGTVPVRGAESRRTNSTTVGPYRHATLRWAVRGAVQSAAAAGRAPADAAAAGMPRPASWTEVIDDMDAKEVVIVDSRPQNAFDLGHVPGAVCLPFVELDARLPEFREQYPPSTALVIYCGNASCSLSKALAAELHTKHGYHNIRYIPDGFLQWRRFARGG